MSGTAGGQTPAGEGRPKPQAPPDRAPATTGATSPPASPARSVSPASLLPCYQEAGTSPYLPSSVVFLLVVLGEVFRREEANGHARGGLDVGVAPDVGSGRRFNAGQD